MLVILLSALDSLDFIRAAPMLQALGHADAINTIKAGSNLQDVKVIGDLKDVKNINEGIDGLRVTNSLPSGETTPLLKTNTLPSEIPPTKNPYIILSPADPPKSFLTNSKSYLKDSWNKLSFKNIGEKATEQGKTAYTKVKDALKNKLSKPPEKPNPAVADGKPVNPQTIENPAGSSQSLEIVPYVPPKPSLPAKSTSMLRNSWDKIVDSASRGPIAKIYRKLKGPMGKLMTKTSEGFKKTSNKVNEGFSKAKDALKKKSPAKVEKTEAPAEVPKNVEKPANPTESGQSLEIVPYVPPSPSLPAKSTSMLRNSWDKIVDSASRGPIAKIYRKLKGPMGKLMTKTSEGFKKTSNKVNEGFSKAKDALKKKSPAKVEKTEAPAEVPKNVEKPANPTESGQSLEIVPYVPPKPNLPTKSTSMLRNSWNKIVDSASQGPIAKIYRKLKGPVGNMFSKMKAAFKKPPPKLEPIFKVDPQ
ncbi:hypothetical protein BY996DRAFT_6408634 [Phakopsora pachyrhizi]|nr:hypothetical protein BY996DRAFT_6408634 [Phakopsora pachyrhizi]